MAASAVLTAVSPFEVLQAYLLERAAFSTDELAFMRTLFVARTLAAGEFLQRAGEPARHAAFVTRGCLRSFVIDANVKLIPGNYVTDGLIDLLQANEFDFNVPTYFIWEGNTMYLPLASVKNVLTELKTHIRRFRLSFDYMAEAVITKTTGDAGVTRLVESFASMGAPWLSGIRDIQALAREMSLNLVENFKTSELGHAYGISRPMTSPIFDFYSVCTLGC